MDKDEGMKYGLTTLFILCTTLLSNEIQVFTANTMKIDLDSKTQIEEVFYGDRDIYLGNQKEIFDFASSKTFIKPGALFLVSGVATKLAANTLSSISSSTSHLNQAGNIQLGVGASILVLGTAAKTYKYITSDNQYMYISIAQNSSGEKTMLQTMIIANYALTHDEIKKIGSKHQRSQIK